MQSIWSRAAQAHVGSRTCILLPGGTAIRRAATAASRYRKPGFSEVFTAFYTTILGTAAVLDAQYKDGRRKELDAKLEAARTKVEQLRHASSLARQGAQQEPPLSETAVNSWAQSEDKKKQTNKPGLMRERMPLNALEALNSICKMDMTERHTHTHGRFLNFLDSVHKAYDPDRRLGREQATFPGISLGSIRSEVLWEMESGTSPVREPMTALQFERYHEMIWRLVGELIEQSYYDELPHNPEQARLNWNSLDSVWHMIRLLRSEGYPRYNHPSLDPEATEKGRKELSDVICRLFEEWSEVDRKNLPKYQVGRICYNLLVCPVPPSIHHLNLLMIGFIMKTAPNLVEIVAQTILQESRLRPTPQTIVCLLVHYRRAREIGKFYDVIRRMVAIDNRGMLQRRRLYADVPKIAALRRWARNSDTTTSLNSKWVIEQAPRNVDIYEALVSGLLSFGRIKDAVKVFVGSLQERVGLSTGLLIQILKLCLYCLDASAARILRQGLLDHIDITVSLLLRPGCPKALVDHLYPVFAMDSSPAWPFSAERASMVSHTRTVEVSAHDSGATRRLNIALFIRNAESHLDRLGKIINRLMRMVSMTNLKDLSLLAAARIHELDGYEGRNRLIAQRVLKHQALYRTARMLENSTWDLRSGTLASVHGYAVHILENNLPRPAQKGGYGHKEEYERKLADIHQIVDRWFQYRVTRLRGTAREERLLILQAEFMLFQGNRLGRYVLSILPTQTKWKKVSLRHDFNIKWFKLDLAKSEENSIWPSAEAVAAFARGPIVRVV